MKDKIESDQTSNFIKYFLLKIYALKYLYISLLAVFLVIALFYNKYSKKVYEISATIGPVKDNRSSLLGSNDLFRGLGTFNTRVNIEDDINSLSSFSQVSASVSNLNLEVEYFSEKDGIFRQTKEMYNNSPFITKIDKSHLQPINTKFYLFPLSDSTFRLTALNKETSYYNYIDNKIVAERQDFTIDTICKFNKTINSRSFKFTISFNKDMLPKKAGKQDLYCFEFFHPEELAKDYLEMIKIEPLSVLASIIKIQFSGENIEKSINFLNKYINSFLEDNLLKKNTVALSTIKFIDSQISDISDSLVISESKLRNFRSANKVMDLSFQGQRIYEQMTQIETEKASLEVQIRYYNYVINLFNTNQDISGVVPPMSANITDPIMNNLITDLVALNTERSGFVNNNAGKNLFLGQIDNKIKVQKKTIVENVTNNLNTLNLTLNELNYRSEKLQKEISTLPGTEMNMVNIQRKFNLNDAIYTFLLQKRSEAAISLASNYPDFEILEPAREITSKIVSPKTFRNYLIAIFLAMLFPTAYFIIRDFFSDKVTSVYDVEHLLNRPVLGIIYSNTKKYESVVSESPKSAIAESFRNLRSKLLLRLRSDKSKVILITSSQPQDGKSFISFNLASSIASVGLKTIIIDCDLRRPRLHTKFNVDNTSGVSTFMDKSSTIDKIIIKTSIDNLFFIPAGPILPNPSELIDAGELDELIRFLESKYECIIIDTSPVGLVSDASQLMKYASQILLVSRNNYTEKTILENAINSLENSKVKSFDVILNDMNIKKSPYSSYSGYYLKD